MRVTLDIDHDCEWKRLAQYFNMKHICGVDEIRVSSSGRGLHLFKRGLPISYEDSLNIRAMLGECETRLRFDGENNRKPKQIAFQAKVIDGKRCEARTIDERDLLALPFKSRLPKGVYIRG